MLHYNILQLFYLFFTSPIIIYWLYYIYIIFQNCLTTFLIFHFCYLLFGWEHKIASHLLTIMWLVQMVTFHLIINTVYFSSEPWLFLHYTYVLLNLPTLILLYNFALNGHTMRIEINSTVLQAVGIMRLFHWLEFNWEATMSRGREERLLKSLSAVRLLLILIKSSSESSFRSSAFFHCVACSLSPSIPCPLLSLRACSVFCSLSGIDSIWAE